MYILGISAYYHDAAATLRGKHMLVTGHPHYPDSFLSFADMAKPITNESISSDKEKIIVLGSGPNRIGQGIEFDYCCVHGLLAIRECGYEAIMINWLTCTS